MSIWHSLSKFELSVVVNLKQVSKSVGVHTTYYSGDYWGQWVKTLADSWHWSKSQINFGGKFEFSSYIS